MIILDTHVLIWWLAEPERLSSPAAQRIYNATSVGISAISCWEIAMLETRGRLRLDRPIGRWIGDALSTPRVTLLPLLPSIAVSAAQLPPDLPGDPADRIICATTLHHQSVLVTKDEALQASRRIPTVW